MRCSCAAGVLAGLAYDDNSVSEWMLRGWSPAHAPIGGEGGVDFGKGVAGVHLGVALDGQHAVPYRPHLVRRRRGRRQQLGTLGQLKHLPGRAARQVSTSAVP